MLITQILSLLMAEVLRLFQWGRHAILLLVLFFTGCMTLQETTVGGRGVNPVKAAEEHVKAAMGYLGRQQLGNAQRHLTRALELDPTSIQGHNAMALSYSMIGDYDLSEASYLQLLDLSPDFSAGRNNYAVLLFQMNRVSEACEQWERVVSDVGYDKRSAAYYNLGQCRLLDDKEEDALLAFKRSTMLDSDNSAAFISLAELNFGRGDYSNARLYYDKYRQLSEHATAKSLLLGIKLSVESGDDNERASRALALKNLYPDSPEYREYQRRARIE